MADDDDEGPKFNRARLEDEFLRHPHSGAFVRNPLLEKTGGLPILFQASEFEHNCLDDALAEKFHVISLTESSLKEVSCGVPASPRGDVTLPALPSRPTLDKASTPQGTPRSIATGRVVLGKLKELPGGYEFVVPLYKSSYVPPKASRRRPVEVRTSSGIIIDKMNIEVTDVGGRFLRIEQINEGLVAVWNRNSPFVVRLGDSVIKVNAARGSAQAMLDELAAAPDVVRLTIRRSPPDKRATSSKELGSAGGEFTRQVSSPRKAGGDQRKQIGTS